MVTSKNGNKYNKLRRLKVMYCLIDLELKALYNLDFLEFFYFKSENIKNIKYYW